jgi:alkyl hydroperoxide reductase subunit AhpC
VSVGPSVDSLEAPSIADAERRMATLYGTLHPSTGDTATVRSMCVIGPDDRVKLTLTSLASTGRTCDEILRVLDSLQLTARHAVATPAVPDARDLRMTPPDR